MVNEMFKHIVLWVLVSASLMLSNQMHAQALLNVPYKTIVTLPHKPADKTLSYGDDPLQFVKMWQAHSSDDKRNPVVIFIHGGCWLNAFSIDHSLPMTSALAQRGFSVWSVEYRRTGDEGGGWPGSFNDIQKAIDFVLKQDGHAGRDNKVFVVGHSAGGHLATLAAASRGGSITAIGLAAITDIARYSNGQNSCQKAVHGFMGGTQQTTPVSYQEATPTSFKFAHLIHGTADSIVPIAQSRQAKTTTIEIEGAGHFDFLHPSSQAFAALVKLIEIKSNEQQ